MLSLQARLNAKKNGGDSTSTSSNSASTSTSSPRRISVRDKLLVREVEEMAGHVPLSCHVHFACPSQLHMFELTVRPTEGMYVGGRFKFSIQVPLEYNIMPPKVKCLTRMWHPNISEDGNVCLSLLRPTSLDSMGWAPTRTLKDVVWGLNSLFTDLLDFDDPLNIEAAENYRLNPVSFQQKVKVYIKQYCPAS